MGNEQNTANNPLHNFSASPFPKIFSKQYSFLHEIRDPHIGPYQIFKHNQNSKDYVIVKSMPTKLPTNIANNLTIKHQNFLKILNISSSEQEILCGESQKMTVFSEYFNYTLASELDRRSRAQEFFPENEIWYLLNSLIISGEQLQRNHAYHGSLMPETVFLTPEGHIKLINPIFMYNELDSYHNLLGDPTEKGFLSPTLLEEFRKRMLNPKHNRVKSDVWSVGMIVLYVGSLYNVRKLYNYETKTLDLEKIGDLIQELTTNLNYSLILRNFVAEMLQINEGDRPDFQELREFLTKPVEELSKASKFNLYMSPSPYKSQNLQKSENITNLSQPLQFHSESSVIQSQIITNNNNNSIVNNPQMQNPNQNALFLSQNSQNFILRSGQNINSASPDLTRFKPIFFTPRKIMYQENSPTVRIVNETPKNNYKNDGETFENFRQKYGEIDSGLDDLTSRIEKALDRSALNIDKYREIIH